MNVNITLVLEEGRVECCQYWTRDKGVAKDANILLSSWGIRPVDVEEIQYTNRFNCPSNAGQEVEVAGMILGFHLTLV